jgi:hypothetical protein
MAWTSPRTWVAGEKPTAATLNTHIRDNFKAIGDAWASYTPTTSAITLGNGTLSGAYMEAGKFVTFRARFILGGTSAITGSPTFTLPVTGTARTFTGDALYYDTSASAFFGGFAFNSGASSVVLRSDASASLSSTVPFTWTTGDEILINGTYEAA